ncbi:hypothetical protein EBZ37_14570 [bacterium]|nr:hypothetical protein [bacterium]
MEKYLPAHLKHLSHSRLFSALDHALGSFRANRIVDERFVEALVTALGKEFEKACDRNPVNTRSVQLSEDGKVVNYRFDRGYWEVVVKDTEISVVDSKMSSVIFREKSDVSVEGSGGGLRKGKRKSESMKRAHTRLVARDTRRSEDSSDDWEP